MHPAFPTCRYDNINPFADNLSSLSALITALTDLDSLCKAIEDAYIVSLTKDKYERWPEKS